MTNRVILVRIRFSDARNGVRGYLSRRWENPARAFVPLDSATEHETELAAGSEEAVTAAARLFSGQCENDLRFERSLFSIEMAMQEGAGVATWKL